MSDRYELNCTPSGWQVFDTKEKRNIANCSTFDGRAAYIVEALNAHHEGNEIAKQPKAYRLITATGAAALSRLVSAALREGAVLHGSPFTDSDENNTRLCQAVLFREETPKPTEEPKSRFKKSIFTPFNINNRVRIKMTDYGRSIARSYAEPFREDAEGWSDWELWNVMHVFGANLSMGGALPFETLIEISQ